MLDDFKPGSKVFSFGEFAAGYAPADWEAMMDRARGLGIGSVRVFLKIEKSPELERFIRASQVAGGALPPALIQ